MMFPKDMANRKRSAIIKPGTNILPRETNVIAVLVEQKETASAEEQRSTDILKQEILAI
jgi:hypothetical protein